MLEDDSYRVLGGVPFFADLSFNLVDNRRILQNESIDIEDGVLFFRDQVTHALLKIFAFLFLVFERLSETGLNNDACCLCRDCRQQADFVAGEFTPTGSLDDQNAERQFSINERYTEK